MAEMEVELKAMKGDNEKWKNMCHAMEAKLLESKKEEEDDEVIEEEGEVYDDHAGEIEAEQKELSSRSSAATASASKSSSKVLSSISADEKSRGIVTEKMETERKVAVMKDRKRPKDIKENPPSRGKNLTSKDKASNKKMKPKART